MAVEVFINEGLFKDMEDRLRRISFIERSAVLQQGFDEVGKIVKKEFRRQITKPGYPGDKTANLPLVKAVRSKKLKQKAGIIVGTLYDLGTGGRHGHLVEVGHEIVLAPNKTPQSHKGSQGTPVTSQYPARTGRVPGKHWLFIAAVKTKGLQKAAVEKSISAALKKADKSGGTV